MLQAFVFDLEDEYAESDIPTTLIRSKADCPGIEVCTAVDEDGFCYTFIVSPSTAQW